MTTKVKTILQIILAVEFMVGLIIFTDFLVEIRIDALICGVVVSSLAAAGWYYSEEYKRVNKTLIKWANLAYMAFLKLICIIMVKEGKID